MAYLKGVDLSGSSDISGSIGIFGQVTGSSFTGSFTGSFLGDVIGTISTASYVDYDNVANKPTLISSSDQISSEISGAFTSDSASFSTRVTDLETFSSSLDDTFVTETELNAATASLSSSLATDIATKANSASFATDIATLDSTTVKLTGDQSIAGTKTFTGAITASDLRVTNTASIGYLQTIYETSSIIYSSGSTKFGDTLDDTHQITGSLLVTGSSYTINGEDIIITSALNASTSSLSSSLATGIASDSASLAASIVSNSSSAATDIAALVVDSASFSTRITSNDVDITALQSDSSSFSTRVTDLETFSSSLDDTFATEAELNAATASLSSSLATDIATKANSASFATDIAALVTDSGSFSTRVTDLETFSSSLDDTFATEAELNAATASLSSSLAVDIAANSESISNIESFPYTGSAIISGSLIVTGSTNISGSVTAYGFNIDDNATGTPALYSSTNLNLSASNAVVVTSSPFRVASLTTTERGTFTAQDGDIIFNTTVGKYQVYSGSAWTNVLQTEDKYDEITVTVVNDGGNKYAFDGVTAPKLSLNKGTTYRFDLSDSSNSNHPLAFRLPNDTSYTTGVTTVGTAGNTGAYVEFDVDFATSSSLKYYCTVHGNGMGNVVQLIDLYDLVATGSLQGTATTASYIAGANVDGTVTSASYAITASYAENVPSGTGFPYTGSAIVSGSLIVTGSIYSDSQIYATASHAISASYATLAQNANTASYVETAQTASYIAGANVDGTVTSASYAITSSYPLEGFIDVSTNGLDFTFTRGNQTTEVVQATITGSVENAVSASYAVTASHALNGGVTSITAGSGITIDQSTGNVTISTDTIVGGSIASSSFADAVTTTLTHNFGSTNVIVATYDESGNEIIPASITLDSANSVTATFGSAQSGDIVAIEAQIGEFATASFTSTGSVTLNHSLGTQDLNVVAYDTNNVQFIPDIEVLDSSNVKATFASPTSGKLLAVARDGSVSASFSNTVNETITHNLSGSAIFVTVYDTSYNEIIPDSVSIVDTSSINLTFAATSSGNVVIAGGAIDATTVTTATTYTQAISGSSSYTVTHNLNAEWPLVQVYESASRAQFVPQSVVSVNASTVNITFSTPFNGFVTINS